MDSLPVHIAVLTIADDAANADRATAQAIRERAANAGHVIVEDEIAKDNEAAIRDQLVRWIAEPNIDVVIVAASLDSEAASAALGPLVMQTLPGFTDLFRWLTFQEIGASAMLSAAEAAQCESTFVFVLPAHEAAVRAAMDKLILPQLDIRTKPKNLVTQMPRLKDEAKRLLAAQEAVPTPIATEKTVGGSGVMPKPPARPRTTTNTIARKPVDPPTKPIDLAKLEKQIALSNVHDANTKQIAVDVHHAETKVVDMSAHQAKTRVVDMSRLPRVPPGADEDAPEETDTLTFDTPPASAAYRSAAPIGVVKSTPLPSIPKPGAPSESKPTPLAKPPPTLSTPSFSTPIARSAPARQPVATPPSPTPTPSSSSANTDTPPVAVPIIRPRSARGAASGSGPARAPTSEPAAPAVAPSESKAADTAMPAASSGTSATSAPTSSPARAPTPTPASTPSAPAGAPSRAPTPPPASTTTSEPSTTARASTPTPASSTPAAGSAAASDAAAAPSAAASSGSSASPSAASAAPATDAASEAPATRAAMETATPPPLPAVPATPARPPRAESPSASESAARLGESQIEEIAELPDDAIEPADSLTSAPAASSAPAATPPPTRPATQPPPARPATQPPPVRPPTQPPPVRPPTQPPPVDPLAAVSARPLGEVDVPQGDFVYPIKKSSGGLILKLLLAAAALAGGFFAFVKLYPQLASTRTEQFASTAPPAVEPALAPAPTEPVADASTESPPVEPEIELEPSEPTTRDTRRRRPDKPVTKPARVPKDSTASKPESGTEEVASADDKGKGEGETSSQPTPASPDCDEVSCVMTKYDRPCCERFRPADSFRPRTHVPDELDKPMVKAGVETVKPRIIACGEKHGVKGTVRVSVSVADVGTVKSVSVVEAPDPALGECVAAAMRNAKFGKSAKGGEFVYPFVF